MVVARTVEPGAVVQAGDVADGALALTEGATDLLSRVLDKDPATTFVIIDEVPTDNWGVDRDSVTNRRRRGK